MKLTQLISILSLTALISTLQTNPYSPNSFKAFLNISITTPIISLLLPESQKLQAPKAAQKPLKLTFQNAYKTLLNTKNTFGQKICGLRAIFEEDKNQLSTPIAKLFLFKKEHYQQFSKKESENPNNELSYKYCLEHNDYMLEDLLLTNWNTNIEEISESEPAINLKIASTLFAKSCMERKIHPDAENLHHAKFMLYLKNMFELDLDPKLEECSKQVTPYHQDEHLVSPKVIFAEHDNFIWRDMSVKLRTYLNCILTKQYKKKSKAKKYLFEDLNLEYITKINKKSNQKPRSKIKRLIKKTDDIYQDMEISKNIKHIYNFNHFPVKYEDDKCLHCNNLIQMLQIGLNKIYPSAKDNDKPSSQFKFTDEHNNLKTSADLNDYTLVIQQMAENGDPRAQYAMGQAYYFGNPGEGIERNQERGVEYYRRAAMENRDAAADFGILALQGKINNTNTDEAISLLKRSVEEGSTQAMNALAYAYQSGEGVERNLQESLNYFEMAAKRGHLDAMANFASLSQFNTSLNRQYDGIKWLGKALKNDGHFAYYLSGYFLAHNTVTQEKLGLTCEEYASNSYKIFAKYLNQQNHEKAFNWFTKKKFDDSMIRLAYGLYIGNFFVCSNLIKIGDVNVLDSMKFLLEKGLQKDLKPRGSHNLLLTGQTATQYLNGQKDKLTDLADLIYKGVKINERVFLEKHKNSYKLFKLGAKRNNSHYSKFSRAWMLQQGLGVKRNLGKALKIYNRIIDDIWESKEPFAAIFPTYIAKSYLLMKKIFVD